MRVSAMLTVVSLITVSAFLQSCTTLGPGDAKTLGDIVGTNLVGAKGATPLDQDKINRTVARLCAGGVWNKNTCEAHNSYRDR
ncbi:hypothetical protein EVB68_084 [Rhizobium phage RHph_Y2_6]|uniref:O-spanin n=1 Tax=Rhizobium phage RHph_Y2_6 TaxID=2509576 RepID=A0A7S5R518_9CAUD|nr:hypothetical protein PP748_gp084 [Rhizobium phage RHph_Y2_6]QIG68821.1 hypothetical protein EVB68_084 [Rhizobium phage RHph_Y2_6]